MKIILLYSLIIINVNFLYAQHLRFDINDCTESTAYISSLMGEKIILVDSISSASNGQFTYNLKDKQLTTGFYRLSFNNNKWIDFIYDGEGITITTNYNNISDSLKVIESDANRFYYAFARLNKNYKAKSELLQLILSRYPTDDDYYKTTQEKFASLQKEYLEFVNNSTKSNPQSFISRYIKSAQLPIIDFNLPLDKQLLFLKTHALDDVNFDDDQLIYSDALTNKTIEYLMYYRNPQLPLELLEKEFMTAVDTILNKAKVNQFVYQHITGYLIDGFKRFGFDKVLDYIVENYVIKDDLCLDVKTEGLIKRRIDQAAYFKIGNSVPDIVLPDLNGKEVFLSRLNPDKILIVFYASWCPHCKELMPKINELYKNQKENRFEVLAISMDNQKEDWLRFVNENCSSVINVSDLNGWDEKAVNDYFIYATPTMFLVDKEMKLIGKPTDLNELNALIVK